MDGDVKNLLEENLRISKENNLMLLKLLKAQKWAQIYRVVYWAIIILVSFGSFYFIQPYLGSLLNLYSGGVSNVNSFQDFSKSIPDAAHLKDFVNQINGQN